MIDGLARYGDAEYVMRMRASADTEWARVEVDGVPKILDGSVSKLLAGASTSEPGLEIARVAGRAA
jgi:hypothetical protein